MKSIGRLPSDRHGVAAVEFALIAPLFLLSLAGIIEFGQAMSIRHSISTAIRRGARAAVVEGATSDAVIEKVRADLSKSLRVQADKLVVKICIGGVENGELSTAATGDEVTVSASVPYSAVGAGFYAHLFRSSSLASACTVEHE